MLGLQTNLAEPPPSLQTNHSLLIASCSGVAVCSTSNPIWRHWQSPMPDIGMGGPSLCGTLGSDKCPIPSSTTSCKSVSRPAPDSSYPNLRNLGTCLPSPSGGSPSRIWGEKRKGHMIGLVINGRLQSLQEEGSHVSPVH